MHLKPHPSVTNKPWNNAPYLGRVLPYYNVTIKEWDENRKMKHIFFYNEPIYILDQ